MTGKLILMRHGKSTWNEKNLFTGWVDVPLSESGEKEAIEGGKKIRDIPIHRAFTSTLNRAQMTAILALKEQASKRLPVLLKHDKAHEGWSRIHSPRTKEQVIEIEVAFELNERMYGELQGKNKKEMAEEVGEKQVQLWRRSFEIAPPKGESLKQTVERAVPFFQKDIEPFLQEGKNVFIAAHGNSLRGIVMYLETLSAEEVVSLEIPTGEPWIYEKLEGGFLRR